MKISFWIPAVVFYVVRVVFSNSVQVGTVLFTTTDLVKKCWTESDKSLLKARLIMQDVLPDPDCIDFSNPEAVAILLDYFHACYRIISTSTYGKLQNLMYLALSDALGGYLRAYVLPFTKRAYYAGQVKYIEAKKLFQLYDDIRVFLKTNGVGWAEPQKLCVKKFHVRPLVITGGAPEACKELYVIEKQGRLHCINTKTVLTTTPRYAEMRQGFPESPENFDCKNQCSRKHRPKCWNRDRRFDDNTDALSFYNFLNSSSGSQKFLKNLARKRSLDAMDERELPPVGECMFEKNNSSDAVKRVIVPLPILDDCQTPHSIAVPFLKQPLRNLKTGCSAFILEYYYLAVVKCFIAKGNSRSDIRNFNGQFHAWLVSQVIPHLCEEQWYPGFGGVLRVLQTIKKFGAENAASDPVMHDIAFMFNQGAEFEIEDGLKEKGKNKVRDVAIEEGGGMDISNSQRHVITTIIIVSMIWLFIFCAFAFYCQATRGHRLLYEGHANPTCSTKCSAKGSARGSARGSHYTRGNNDMVNFHFLVKFFKRDESRKNEPEDLCLKIGKGKDTRHATVQIKECPPKKKQWPLEEKRERKPGEGDCFAYFGSLLSSVFPTQPYLSSFEKPGYHKSDDRSGGDVKFKDQGQGDQVQMLWKKSSSLFANTVPSKEGREEKAAKVIYESTVSRTGSEDLRGITNTNSCSACLEDETKGYTTDKQTSSCYCCESCPFAHTTTTTSTQMGEKLSSATMEFFDDVIAKHKPKKSSTQDSTADSDSECSTTSESDY